MCEEVVVRLKGREPIWCDSAGELASALGLHTAQLPVSAYMGHDYRPSFNECLCHIEFRKLAKASGLRVTKHGFDRGHMGEWELRHPNAATARRRCVGE